MSTEANKRLVRRYIEEIVNTGDISAIEAFVSADYAEVYRGVRHELGVEGAKRHVVGVRETYPDLLLTVEQQIAEGEWVVTCYTMRGTLRGVIAQTLCKKKGGGMVAAHELLLVNPAVSNLIREGKTFQIPTIMQTGKQSGMTTRNDSLLELVKAGLVESHQAYSKAVARSEFRALLERHHLRLDGI